MTDMVCFVDVILPNSTQQWMCLRVCRIIFYHKGQSTNLLIGPLSTHDQVDATMIDGHLRRLTFSFLN